MKATGFLRVFTLFLFINVCYNIQSVEKNRRLETV